METSVHTVTASLSLRDHGGTYLLKQMSTPVLADCPRGSELIQGTIGLALKIRKYFDVFYVQ